MLVYSTFSNSLDVIKNDFNINYWNEKNLKLVTYCIILSMNWTKKSKSHSGFHEVFNIKNGNLTEKKYTHIDNDLINSEVFL